MGAEYNYYLGRRDINTHKIYPLGPYDKDGKLLSVLSVSDSYASKDFNELFMQPMNREDITDELNDSMDFFGGEKIRDFNERELETSLKWHGYYGISSLGSGNGLASGYVNREELNEYLRFVDRNNRSFSPDDFDILHEHIYAALSDEERKNYVYYTWKDWRDIRCVAHEICIMYETFAYQLRDYSSKQNKDLHPVVIMFYSR